MASPAKGHLRDPRVGGQDRPISHGSRIKNLGNITLDAATKRARAERAAVVAVLAGHTQRANLVSYVSSFLPRGAPTEMLLPIDVRRALSGRGSTQGRSGSRSCAQHRLRASVAIAAAVQGGPLLAGNGQKFPQLPKN